MKKIVTIIAVIAMIYVLSTTALAQISVTETETKADPYVISAKDNFEKFITDSTTDNMNGTPTYIRLDGDITASDNTFSIGRNGAGKNIDLD